MKLPVSSAPVRQVKVRMQDLPDDWYEVEFESVQVKQIPDHVRQKYGMKQTHSVNIQMRVLSGNYKGNIIFDTLYPVVDQFGHPTSTFAIKLSRMGCPVDAEFDTATIEGIKAHVRLAKPRPNKKNKVIDYGTHGDNPRIIAKDSGGLYVEEIENAKAEMAELLGE